MVTVDKVNLEDGHNTEPVVKVFVIDKGDVVVLCKTEQTPCADVNEYIAESAG